MISMLVYKVADRNFVPKSGVKYVFVFAGSPKFINYEDFN